LSVMLKGRIRGCDEVDSCSRERDQVST